MIMKTRTASGVLCPVFGGINKNTGIATKY